MKIRAQIGMVLNLDKCIGCHTCSVTCKNVWTSRQGVEYAWFNNVETKPGIGYPDDWENQAKWQGGFERTATGGLRPKQGNKLTILSRIFANPYLPKIDDYYEPWNYEYIAAFEKVLGHAVERSRTRLLAYCLMPNHWHLLVWPRKAGELSGFIGWLTLTHTQRWHAHRHSAGSGHVYQGRFKSFPIQEDEHLYTVARYVERNALRANLARRAEQWRWGSLYRWLRGAAEDKELLAAWPLPRKPNWGDHVNAPQTEAELAAVRGSVHRGSPFGDASWSEKTVRRLGLESTLRPRGRPKKPIIGS